MNIALLTSSDYPEHGAPETFVRNLFTGLSSASSKVTIFKFWGTRYSSNARYDYVQNYLFRSPPARIILLQLLDYFAKISYAPVFIFRLRYIVKANCLFIYGIDTSLFLLPVLLACKCFNLPVYRFVTEIYSCRSYITHFIKWPDVAFRYFQIAFFDRYFNGILVLSNYLKQILSTHNVPNQRILLIHNLIDASSNVVSSKPEKNTICFFGYISRENGIDILLNQFSVVQQHFPLAKLFLAGPLSNDIDWINYFDSFKNISYLGVLDKFQLNTLISKCDVLVNPRPIGLGQLSGFPTKFGEYALSGRPFISTLIPDLVSCFPAPQYTFWALDPYELASKLVAYFTDPSPLVDDCNTARLWALDNLCCLKKARSIASFVKSTSTIRL